MIDEQKLTRILDDARVPRDVHIGTNSVEDRIAWLARRSRANELTANLRFETFELEFGVLTTLSAAGSSEWFTVDEVQGRLEYGERDEIKLALEYLYSRKLIARVNNGFKGDVYSNLDE